MSPFTVYSRTQSYIFPFSDQLIVEQLQPSHHRAARDTTKKCIDQDSCCSGPPISNFHATDKEVSQQCYKELNFDRGSIRGPLTEEQKNQIKVSNLTINYKNSFFYINLYFLSSVWLNVLEKRKDM